MAKIETKTHFVKPETHWRVEMPMHQFGNALDTLSLLVNGIDDPEIAGALDGLHLSLCNAYAELKEIIMPDT